VKQVTIHAAKTDLSRLIEEACAGEEIIIARGSVPVVRLVPVQAPAPARVFGSMRGRARTDDAFFEPLPAEEVAAWEPLKEP
jgi:prevent-host-death family protein